MDANRFHVLTPRGQRQDGGTTYAFLVPEHSCAVLFYDIMELPWPIIYRTAKCYDYDSRLIVSPTPFFVFENKELVVNSNQDPFTKIEYALIKIAALLCLLATLYKVVKHEFGW